MNKNPGYQHFFSLRMKSDTISMKYNAKLNPFFQFCESVENEYQLENFLQETRPEKTHNNQKVNSVSIQRNIGTHKKLQ